MARARSPGRTSTSAVAARSGRGTWRSSAGCPRSVHRCRPLPRSAPSRQCSAFAVDERNFTQPSSISCDVERSVVIGFTHEPALNGAPISVPNEVNFESVAWITACCRRRAEEVRRLARVELVHADARVDQRLLAVHVLGTLAEAPALPLLAARRGPVGAVEPVREHGVGTSTVIPPSASISPLNCEKFTSITWLIWQPGQVAHRADCERDAAALHREVDLGVADARNRHDDVARDREVRDAVVRRVGAHEHDRVGVVVGRAARRSARCRFRARGCPSACESSSPFCLLSAACARSVEPLVGVADAAREREVARHRPDHEEHDQAEQAEDDQAPPRRPLRQAGTGTRRARAYGTGCDRAAATRASRLRRRSCPGARARTAPSP